MVARYCAVDRHLSHQFVLLHQWKSGVWVNLSEHNILKNRDMAGAHPASAILDASGKSQQEINDSIAVKFLKASEIGLTKWVDYTLPPYTAQQYAQAYNNGINLAIAITQAFNEGYAGAVLENGFYPTCYKQVSGATYGTPLTVIDSIYNFEINFNGSTLFSIFDSNNRSPYDQTTNAPYLLNGAQLALTNNTNLTIKNAKFRGDQYFRSWVSGENNTEHTSAIQLNANNWNTKVIDCDFTGFRGDGINGNSKGETLYNLAMWKQGGLDSSGSEITETGSYRTSLLDLQGKNIKRNSVQISTTGYLRSPSFRNEVVGVFFYNSIGAFISTEKARHTDFIILPKDCRYIRFVAYNDERIDVTVSYDDYVILTTGNSEYAVVDNCVFYENHRGGISNLCGKTLVDNCEFFDEGGTKQGFGKYADPTRYAINFEDIYVSALEVRNTRIRNHTQAILCNGAKLTVVNSTIKDIEFMGVGFYGSLNSIISGNTFENVGTLVSLSTGNTILRKRQSIFSENIVRDCGLSLDLSLTTGVSFNFSHNDLIRTKVYLVGDSKNLVVQGNTTREVAGQYISTFVVKNALSCVGNSVLRNSAFSYNTGWSNIHISAALSRDNYLLLDVPTTRMLIPSVANEVIATNGYKISSANKIYNLSLMSKTTTGFSTHTDLHNMQDMEFNKTVLSITGGGDLCGGSINIDSSIFVDSPINTTIISATGTTPVNINIRDTEFNLDTIGWLFYNNQLVTNPINIVFENCIFRSSSARSIPFIAGNLANTTAVTKDCKFFNVKNTDAILTFFGSAKITYAPPSLAAGEVQSTTVTLTGAAVGDAVVCSFSLALGGTRMWAEVTSANTVTVYHQNPTGAAVDIASGTLAVKLV